ncbi:MAG: YraN family protein [bacterium]|nr:YraN family protein [bacterium]
MNSVKTWVSGEEQAKDYLIKDGFIVLAQNYKNELGEIDIIAIDPIKRQETKLKERLDNKEINEKVYKRFLAQLENTLVFVEVKTRETNFLGDALYAVDMNKQRKISQAANTFLKLNKKYKGYPARYDVIGITNGKLTHIENAFNDLYN